MSANKNYECHSCKKLCKFVVCLCTQTWRKPIPVYNMPEIILKESQP